MQVAAPLALAEVAAVEGLVAVVAVVEISIVVVLVEEKLVAWTPFVAPQRIIAELAVDEVKYKFTYRDVVHREIEIESKSPSGDEKISIISKHFLQKYPNALSIWMPSKLELGLALQDLINSGNREIIAGGRISQTMYSTLYDYWKEKSEFIRKQ